MSQPQPQPEQYIVGGTPAPSNRYPYLVSLSTDASATNHDCAATLIAPDVLLSAAHCRGSFRFATLGMYDRKSKDEEKSGQRITIRTDKTVQHPQYRWTVSNPDIDYDFLLIKLAQPVDIVQYPPIKLNRSPRRPNYDAQPLTIVGWGATNPAGGKLSSTLLQATVGYVTPQTCDRADGYIHGDYYSYRGFLTNSMMCAWSPTSDACLGDSGGPLVVPDDNLVTNGRNDVQVGIVSFGVGCNSPDFPGLYSRISDQIGWIDEVVCELSDDPPRDFACGRPTQRPTQRPTRSPTRSPTGRPTVRPTVRPTLRPSAAPVKADQQQSVLEFLLGGDSEDGGGGDSGGGSGGDDEDPAASMPMASPTVFDGPAMEPTDPPIDAADLVWFDNDDAPDASLSTATNAAQSQMRGNGSGKNSESNTNDLILIVAASVGGVALVALLVVMAVLLSKRRKEQNADDDDNEKDQNPASLCVRVLQPQDATELGQTVDHRGRPRSLRTAAAMEGGEPSVEVVADGYR